MIDASQSADANGTRDKLGQVLDNDRGLQRRMLLQNLLISQFLIMRNYSKFFITACFMLVLSSMSCSQKKSNSREETEISSMDSTARAVKENTRKLEEQTKKVEASLEQLDKEFETTK